MNWGPHPYQRSKTNIFSQEQPKNKKIRRTIRLLRCQKNCRRGTSAPCFFMSPIIRTRPRKEMRERQRVASERRQFPRGPASPIPPAHRRGIAMERNQPYSPPCTQPPTTAQPPAVAGYPASDTTTTPLSKQKQGTLIYQKSVTPFPVSHLTHKEGDPSTPY